MSVAKFLTAFMESQADVAALIADRFYPIHAVQTDTRPYVTYQTITGGSMHTLGGPEGVEFETVQLNIVADTDVQAKRIARLIAGTKGDVRLNCFRGVKGGVVVKGCWLEDQRNMPGPITHAQGRAPAEVQQDYRIWVDEFAAV